MARTATYRSIKHQPEDRNLEKKNNTNKHNTSTAQHTNMLEAEFYPSVILSPPQQLCIFTSNIESWSWFSSNVTNNTDRDFDSNSTQYDDSDSCHSRSGELLPVETSSTAKHVQRSSRSAASRYLGSFLDHARNRRVTSS
jgi:hypothetical protein